MLEGDLLRRALLNRVAARRTGRPAKPAGAMHLFLACAIRDSEWILPPALAPFGTVTVFDWKSRGFDEFQPGWLARRDEMNREMLAEFQAANSRQPVDAVVGYLSGRNTSPETVRAMAAIGAVVFNFCFDDTLYFSDPVLGGRPAGPACIASDVDLNLTSTASSLVKYAVHGGLAAFFPEAAHPDVHRPYDIPFEFDVSFVGTRYGPRGRFLESLIRREIRVACFGRGWERGPLSNEDMIRLYSRSRINLGISGIGQSLKLMHLKGRDFEVPMAGGLYLTQDNPELNLVYDVGAEILAYHDAEDCARTIRKLIADPDLAAGIRAAGRARALRDHTYQTRWGNVFRLAALLTD
ncbi:MAG: hypothetical protein FD180_4130 [Planctomycetota bacterium]|nr:MAG: hypothetical protein FD180_4130 [Planctomycetota bacterium]